MELAPALSREPIYSETPWHPVSVPLAQFFPSHRKLAQVVDELQRETEELRNKSRELENERNALQAQVRRLEKEIQESKLRDFKPHDDGTQGIALKFERDEIRILYEKLVVEKSELEKQLSEFREELEMHGERLWAPPGHVHSPITDPKDRFVRDAVVREAEPGNLTLFDNLPDLSLDEESQLRLLGWLSEHGSKFPFSDGPAPEWRYHTQNGHFGHADAALLFAMLLEYKPSRLIELGCGYSSLLVMDVNDRFLNHQLDAVFYDSLSDGVLSSLTPLDSYRERVHAKRSQELPTAEFEQLQRGDILSLESSHVAKTGSDVCDILFRILPSLAPGVLVHVHDVYYPFEYPESWVVQDNRSWNETYILRAFLQFNATFRVLFFNDLMARKYAGQMTAAFPGLVDMHASSLWLEKVA